MCYAFLTMNLQDFLAEHKLTAYRFSKMAKVDRAILSRFLRGKCYLSDQTKFKIIKAAGGKVKLTDLAVEK